MKMPLLLLAFLLPIQAQPHERSFDDRVRQAKQLEDTNDGKAYQEALWKKVGTYTAKAMQRCFPREAPPDTTSFTLVGDLGADALLHRVEVRPATAMSRCFAVSFALAPFPPAPHAFLRNGLPLEIDMQIKP